MRWYAGWCPGPQSDHNDAAPPPRPDGSRILSDRPPLWACGEWGWQVRTLTVEHWQVTILGACLASDDELASALRRAARTGAWDQLAALPGSFTTVRTGADGVLVVPDLAGAWPLFFTSWAGGIAYCSSPLPLADLTGAGPDPYWLAARLMAAGLPDATGGRSAFAGISRSRPGHMVLLGGQEPRQQPVDMRLGGLPFAEGAEQLRHALLTAVRGRADRAESLSSDLSGGLDSSSLALLASRYRTSPVPAITYVDPVGGGEDDLAYALLCARADPGLEHIVICPPPDALPLARLDRAPLLDEPAQDVLMWARDQALLAPAAGGLHMTGDGGDCVLAGPLAYLADLARPSTAGRFLSEAAAWARLRHRPAHAVVRAALRMARTSYPQALAAVAGQLRGGTVPPRRGVESALRWCALSPAAAWATRQARLQLAAHLERLVHADRSGHLATEGGADAEALRLVRAAGADARPYAQVGASFGVDLHTPYLDNQVIAACSAVPVIDRTTTRAPKPLLGAALAGLVPAELLARRTKGAFTACLYSGLRRAAPDVLDLLERPRLAELGLIEAAPARQAAGLLLDGAEGPMSAVCDVLATELWLRQLAAPRPRLWGPATSPLERPQELAHARPARP
ncbi:albusnodin/ikarugamycin family macrolactam cyclase [Nonomuraea sp. NPDC049646]|uniref:albusnodin/ikarugamycin family macrolactam cyclase n=1 Tax=unclassified Nonomuraea TaxID=2593643 RepID=UPI0037B0A3CA